MAKTTPAKNPKTLAEVAGNVFSGIVAVFLAVTFTAFPLYYHHYYFDILVYKYKFYYISVLVFAAVCLLTALIFCFVDQMEYQGENRKRLFENLKWKNLKKKMTAAEFFLLLFLFFAIISTLQSDYLFESFWGNEGRFSGLFLILLYVLTVFLIGRLGRMKQWYLDLLLLSGILVCLFGITDYFRMDILGWKAGIKPGQADSFTSTMGNINTYTAYVALIVGTAAGLFSVEKNLFRRIWYYIVYLIALFAIITGQSDNAYLALGALFAILPLILFATRTGVKRYALLIASFIMVIKVIDAVNIKYAEKVIGLSGLFDFMTKYDKLEYIVIAVWLLVAVLYISDWLLFKEREDKVGIWLRGIWLVLIALGLAGVIFVLYDANFGGHAERYQALSRYVIFDDNWGTTRGYCWRIGWQSYVKQPMHHKLFGFGPDTFGILTMPFREQTIADLGVFFESAHNEYFQYLVTMGPFATLAYILFLASAWIQMAKNSLKKPWILAPLLASLCYGAQALVNINLPIATPVMWTLTAVGLALCHECRRKESVSKIPEM